jgi:dephospho-CoA kinase
LGRINSQWTDEQRVSKSDFVIEIDSEIARRKTDEILKILKIKQNES